MLRGGSGPDGPGQSTRGGPSSAAGERTLHIHMRFYIEQILKDSLIAIKRVREEWYRPFSLMPLDTTGA